MSRPRQQPNGDLIFPRRGDPPADNIPNYERDKEDPFLFHLIIEPCGFRENRLTIQRCGKTRCVMWCNLLKREVSPFYCDTCDKRG